MAHPSQRPLLASVPLLALAAFAISPLPAYAQGAPEPGGAGRPVTPSGPTGPNNPDTNPASPTGPQPPLPPTNPDAPAPGSIDRPLGTGNDSQVTIPETAAPRTPSDGSGTVAPTRDTPGAVSEKPPSKKHRMHHGDKSAPEGTDPATGAGISSGAGTGADTLGGNTPTTQDSNASMGGSTAPSSTAAGSGDFAQSDKDHDGNLSMLEFASMMSGNGKAVAQARTSKKANNAATDALNRAAARFMELDSNKDGRLSPEEAGSAGSTAQNTSL